MGLGLWGFSGVCLRVFEVFRAPAFGGVMYFFTGVTLSLSVCCKLGRPQRLQYPLIKEYTLEILLQFKVYSLIKGYWSLWVFGFTQAGEHAAPSSSPRETHTD